MKMRTLRKLRAGRRTLNGLLCTSNEEYRAVQFTWTLGGPRIQLTALELPEQGAPPAVGSPAAPPRDLPRDVRERRTRHLDCSESGIESGMATQTQDKKDYKKTLNLPR